MSGGALVLAAHGSRSDPAANALVRRLAQAVRERRLFDEVAVAFHQGEPGFDTVLDELESEAVTVVPVMTSAGHYADVVLPDALAQNRRFPDVRLRRTPPVGAHPGIAPLVARRVSELLREYGLPRADTTLLLAGHGTRRHSASRDTTLHLAETLRRRRVAGEVIAGFVDDDPGLAEALGTRPEGPVLVLPFLIGGGSHAAEDIPRAVGLEPGEFPLAGRVDHRLIVVDHALGTLPGLLDVIVDLARRHPPPPPRLTRRGGGRSPLTTTGTVRLVGGGPGDPGLITVRGLDLLRRADVVIHDRLIGPELLQEAGAGAELVDVGKGPGHAPLSQEQINRLLVDRARAGREVVRLKGGDPFVFGRGSEELAACREAGVPCEVVPGVSSAIAGPAAAGIPVTARGIARSFAVVTAHQAGQDGEHDVAPLAAVDTIVVLMGRSSLPAFTARLVAAGRDPDTPAACIQSATLPAQRVTLATLATIADAAERDGLEAPIVTVIGEVARMGVDGAMSIAMPAREAAAIAEA
ncbi:MAG: uroporphyrinogen-III C-methyltransferase [Gemmatimonadales bacterium]|nr:uroporphyrinogen-III C-methyltransferase [Gemmatimonadales bacterium]